MVREIVGAAFLLSGCTQQDYGVKVQDPDSGGPVLNFPETISANFDISIDVAFQRTNFGQDVSRCQLQVAMYYYYQSDGFGEREEGPGPDGEGEHGTEDGGQGHGGGRIEHPSEPGECVFSSFEEIPGFTLVP